MAQQEEEKSVELKVGDHVLFVPWHKELSDEEWQLRGRIIEIHVTGGLLGVRLGRTEQIGDKFAVIRLDDDVEPWEHERPNRTVTRLISGHKWKILD